MKQREREEFKYKQFFGYLTPILMSKHKRALSVINRTKPLSYLQWLLALCEVRHQLSNSNPNRVYMSGVSSLHSVTTASHKNDPEMLEALIPPSKNCTLRRLCDNRKLFQ